MALVNYSMNHFFLFFTFYLFIRRQMKEIYDLFILLSSPDLLQSFLIEIEDTVGEDIKKLYLLLWTNNFCVFIIKDKDMSMPTHISLTLCLPVQPIPRRGSDNETFVDTWRFVITNTWLVSKLYILRKFSPVMINPVQLP